SAASSRHSRWWPGSASPPGGGRSRTSPDRRKARPGSFGTAFRRDRRSRRSAARRRMSGRRELPRREPRYRALIQTSLRRPEPPPRKGRGPGANFFGWLRSSTHQIESSGGGAEGPVIGFKGPGSLAADDLAALRQQGLPDLLLGAGGRGHWAASAGRRSVRRRSMVERQAASRSPPYGAL